MQPPESRADITTKEDVRIFVDAFYSGIKEDELLAPVFALRIREGQWPVHLARMYSFWETVLFKEGSYRGNPFARHASLPVEAVHFERWVSLFKGTIDERFAGKRAEEVKLRAEKMGLLFAAKLKYIRQHPDFVPIV